MMEFSKNFGIVSNGFFWRGGGMIRVGSKIEGRVKESFESHRDFFDSLENYKSTRRVLLIYSTIIIRLKIDRKIDILRNN